MATRSGPTPGRGLTPRVPLLGLILLFGPGGCGSPTSSPDTTNNLPLITFNSVDVDATFLTDINVTITGTLVASADWTQAANDIEIYVTNTTCNYTLAVEVRQFCTLLGKTNDPTAKPKILSMNITPGIYRVFVANFGPAGPESGTLQISLRGH